jgi:hypothetical protein
MGDMAVPALTPVAAPLVLRTLLASLGELVASGENGAEPATWTPPERKKAISMTDPERICSKAYFF